MAFVRKKVKSFKWPVAVEEPADGGVFETSTFDAVFRRVQVSELKDGDDFDTLKTILIGWEGIQDEDGKPIEFSQKALKELSDDACWVRSVVKTYVDALAGAKEGN